MAQRVRRQALREPAAPHLGRCFVAQPLFAQIARRGARGGLFAAQHLAVQAAHLGVVQGAGGARDHRLRPRIHVLAHQRHREVAGEEGAVVFKHHQVVAGQFAVGRIGVRQVDGAVGDGLVGEGVFDAIGRPVETVGFLQSGPAVAPFQHLVGKCHPQIAVAGEVGDAAQPARLGGGGRDGQGIRIVEAEGRQHLRAVRRQGRGQRGVVRFGNVLDRLRDGAGVFDVDVDVARHQRVVADLRAAEPQLALHREALAGEQLRDDFPQNVGLAEGLAGDDDGFGRGEHGAGERGDHSQCAAQRAPPALRRAFHDAEARSERTKSSAGAAATSAGAPV